jgi:hypothetical protein
MRARYITDEKLLTLKENPKAVLEEMSTNDDNRWLNDFFREENPIGTSKIEVSDFFLDCSKAKPIDTDLENSKRIYRNMMGLTDAQASDERMWVGMALTYFYDYLVYRWGISDNSIKYRWLFPYTYRRSLFFNGLARLWWISRITYDKSRENPFELTEYFYQKGTFMENLFYRNFSNSESVRLALLGAMKQFEDDGGTINKPVFLEILKYISFLGGVSILDAFEKDELQEKIYIKLIQIDEELNRGKNKFKLED